jgi:DNA-binding Xre family transcriptional regulator
MREKNITTYTLIHKFGMNAQTIHALKHNQGISIYTLERLCTILNCTPNEVVQFYNAENNDKN